MPKKKPNQNQPNPQAIAIYKNLAFLGAVILLICSLLSHLGLHPNPLLPWLVTAISTPAILIALMESLDAIAEDRWRDVLLVGVEVFLYGAALHGVWSVVGCVVGVWSAVRSAV